MSNYDSIDEALNIESDIVESKPIKKPEIVKSKDDDIEKDYVYSRANLYSLIEKGQEAINGIMEVAGEGGSPRAYEVAGQLIKSVADTTDKLIDLQKKLKEVEDETKKLQTMLPIMQCLLVPHQNFKKCSSKVF
ncbi:terminase small subunit [Synechococcus phage S-SKS1]|uniref:Terminase small subunit n=1 Tax=Synechococcus phage S-SKS1 TaxID=754042 RepID=M4QS05_9CAUD|nr:terminase small subunit [Synechococcus phage S-SKS1]AGH31663.1 terminase small subunit [Synechococcus phage S-SKS1]